MDDLSPILPGFYADGKGRLYLDVREFLASSGLPDTPECRAVVWEEIAEIFAMEVIEIVS